MEATPNKRANEKVTHSIQPEFQEFQNAACCSIEPERKKKDEIGCSEVLWERREGEDEPELVP